MDRLVKITLKIETPRARESAARSTESRCRTNFANDDPPPPPRAHLPWEPWTREEVDALNRWVTYGWRK